MKKYVVLFMVVCLLAMDSGAWADYWNEGHSGTEADPYVIDTNADLEALRDRVNAGTESGDMWYKLTENLNISAMTDWESIGNSESLAFTGHFDGKEKSIHLNISRGDQTGLLGYVRTEADQYAVKNLTVSGTVNAPSASGIITDLHSGIINNCTFTGKLIRTKQSFWGGNVGGVVGNMTGGSIENCKVEGTTLSTFDRAGGIVGYAKIANFEAIKNCTFSGTVNAGKGGSYGGGIVGYIEGGNVQNNHVTADTSASSEVKATAYAGGIAGRIGESTVLESCYVSSLVTVSGGSDAIGGIVGLMNASTVRNNQSYASISGDIVNMGGVVGKLDAASYTIDNNRYSSAEHGIDNNAQGVPSEEGYIKVGASIAITTTSPLPDAVVNSPYTTTLATDSTTAVVWILTNGTNFPEGLELGRSTGQISGTPTVSGSFPFTVTASYCTASAVRSLTLTVYAYASVLKQFSLFEVRGVFPVMTTPPSHYL